MQTASERRRAELEADIAVLVTEKMRLERENRRLKNTIRKLRDAMCSAHTVACAALVEGALDE